MYSQGHIQPQSTLFQFTRWNEHVHQRIEPQRFLSLDAAIGCDATRAWHGLYSSFHWFQKKHSLNGCSLAGLLQDNHLHCITGVLAAAQPAAAVQSVQQAPAAQATSPLAQTTSSQPMATPQHQQGLFMKQQAAAFFIPHQQVNQVGRSHISLLKALYITLCWQSCCHLAIIWSHFTAIFHLLSLNSFSWRLLGHDHGPLYAHAVYVRTPLFVLYPFNSKPQGHSEVLIKVHRLVCT